MARLRDETFVPTEAHRTVYDELYAEYIRLHDLFGRGGDPAMKTLRRIRSAVAASGRARPAGPARR
jgi:L-ribulokinase